MNAKQNQRQKMNIDVNPETTPVLYTDNVIVTANQMGVVIEICQRVGPQRLKIVSRVGMSREHAKKMVEEMGKTLAMTEGQVQKS